MTIRAHHQRPQTQRRPAFSLLEIMIAIGILGVGLVMVAAIFPVALSQHKDNIERLRATGLVSKAQAIIHTKFDSSKLWVHPDFLPGGAMAGQDSPWYMLPMANLAVGTDTWDAMSVNAPSATNMAYADAISQFWGTGGYGGDGNFGWGGVLVGTDMLSDRSAPYTNNDPNSPFTEAEFVAVPNRFVWYGFYRWLANGSVAYAAAICKQSRDSTYLQQDLSGGLFILNATGTPIRRLPVPWRIAVRYDGVNNRLFSDQGDDEGLGEIAPRGSRIMIGGLSRDYGLGTYGPPVPAGRILTVTSVFDDNIAPGNTTSGPYKPLAIEVIENISDLPDSNVADVRFDVWVFPPPVVGSDSGTVLFGAKSPLMEWKSSL